MEFGMKITLLICLVFAFSVDAHPSSKKCRFPALFNFGDSNSDTGGANAIFGSVNWPNGITSGKPFKRFSDGRLIIDFLAQSLGFPYLNSTLEKDTSISYRYGANFAVGGQRVNPSQIAGTTFWAQHLDEQVNRFFAFKALAIASQKSNRTRLYPNPPAFRKALYTIDIGQNDVGSFFSASTASQILDYYLKSVQRLLDGGAKYMWIHNTCPWGCLPIAVNTCPNMYQHTCTLDKYGCISEHNERAQAFNSELKKRVDLLRKQYPKAVITLVDMYSAKLSLMDHVQGFDDSLKLRYCCGAPGVDCALIGIACPDPSKYLSWDGTHYTEAANKFLAKLVLNGTYSEPRVGVSECCTKH